MSAVIGMNLGSYVLLCTDTRVTVPGPPARWTDGPCKISRTAIGLITGMGFEVLLGAVDAKMARTAITSTSALAPLVDGARASVLSMIPADYRTEVARDTFWILTYTTQVEAGRAMRLAIAHASTGYQPLPVEAFVGVPYDMTPGDCAWYTDRLLQEIRPLTRTDDLSAHLEHHMALAARYLSELATASPYVSPTYHIGIDSLDHGSSISGQCDGDSNRCARLH